MKLFEDLPSQKTPISAEMLNQIKDNLVVVSPTEPTGDNREKVWMQKGKNLFNVNQLNVLLVNNASYSKQNNEIIVTSNGDYSRIELLVKLEVGKTYFLSTNVTNSIAGRTNISIYSSGYTIKYTEQYVYDTAGIFGVVFTPEEENIIIVLYSNASSDNDTNTVNFSNIQLEQGSTATDYEEYIEPKMYVKNDNDVYEEFIKKATEFEAVSRGDSTNFNNFTQNGFYQCNFQNGTNTPNAYATGMLLVFGSYYISQLYIADLNGTTVAYARTSQNKGTSWSNWVQLA